MKHKLYTLFYPPASLDPWTRYLILVNSVMIRPIGNTLPMMLSGAAY